MNSNNVAQYRGNIDFITLLRGPAALLVIYDHLVATWLDKNNLSWYPLTVIRKYITTPMGIIQDFGFFGVVLFFLLSGFIITHVLIREGQVDFIFKRIFRIYPPLIVSIILIIIVKVIQYFVTKDTMVLNDLTIKNIVLSSTLLNYFFVNQVPINGVAWTLVIEMIFYFSCFLLYYFIKTKPFISILINDIICLLIILLSKRFNDNFFLFSASVAYLPFLIMGQIIYFYRIKQINLVGVVLLSIFNYYVLIQGIVRIHIRFYDISNSYVVSFLYAYFIFIIALLANDYLKLPKLFELCSKTSYSLYLNHGTLGMIAMSIIYPMTGYLLAFFIVLVLVFIISYLSWYFVERPSQSLARSLLKKFFYIRQKNDVGTSTT